MPGHFIYSKRQNAFRFGVYCAGFWPLKAAYFLTKSGRIRRRQYSKRNYLFRLLYTLARHTSDKSSRHLLFFSPSAVKGGSYRSQRGYYYKDYDEMTVAPIAQR